MGDTLSVKVFQALSAALALRPGRRLILSDSGNFPSDLYVAQGLARAIHSPEALNRAFRPGGFLRSFDLRPELGRITAPTLILAGRHDWICAPEFSEEIHRLVPGSDLRIFENSSHSIRADEPEALVDAIRGFVVHNRGRRAG